MWVATIFPYSKEFITFSLGEGINTNFGVHYTTKKHFGFQLEGSYLVGTKKKKSVEFFPNDFFSKEIDVQFYRLIPQIYFEHVVNKWAFQFHLGAIMNTGNFTITQENYTANGLNFRYVDKFSKGVSFGTISGIKASYQLKDRVSIFLDANLINASHSPLKRKTMEIIQGTTNVTETVSISQLETEFNDAYEHNLPQDLNLPSQQLKIIVPNSSVGLQFGFHFMIWKKPVPKVVKELI